MVIIMNHNYPHISDTKFPDLPTVDVYRYRNEYDYDRYKDSVRIKMMNVSWCGDYDNTVYFDTKQKRDEWFEAQKGLVKELPTMFRLYNDGTVKVDLPIDECMDYNYVMIDYGKLPNQERESDQSKMFYFINNVTQESPNATTLYLSVDYWTTFINDMDISYVNLARGHAPMADSDIDAYLSNPIDNSEYLLTSDVSYGEFQRIASNENVVLNETESDLYLGFMTNSDIDGDWNNKIPAKPYENTQGYSAVDIFVIEAGEWANFRDRVLIQCPQFYETVKGMFLVPKKLVTCTLAFRFCGFWCSFIDSTSDETIATFEITKEKFGYPDNISNISKLYTYPYSAIEVNDFKGNTSIIKIEDTSGSLEMHTIFGYMYPFLNVEAYMLGIGGNVTANISFRNSQNNVFHIGGRYYDFTNKWSIPVFAVQISAEKNWLLNSKIGADASKASAYANAAVAETNAALQVNMNTTGTSLANQLLDGQLILNNDVIDANTNVSTAVISGTAMSQVEASELQAANTSNVMTTVAGNSANASVINSGINGMAGIVNGAISGASGGPIGVGLGAAQGAINGITGFATTAVSANAAVTNASTQAAGVMTSATIANNLTEQVAGINTSALTSQATIAKNNNENSTTVQKAYNNLTNNNTNAFTTGSTANSANVTRSNADRAWNAAYDQTMLTNPPMFGNMTGTPDIISKPFGLSYNIVTQSKNAIRQAAEQFLRYGYTLNMEWNVDTFNKMPKFTYWECDKVYCNDNGVYEGAQDMIKSILNQGTTVWRNPEEIGLISIYTNI